MPVSAAAAVIATNFSQHTPSHVPQLEAAAASTLRLPGARVRAAIAHCFNALSGNALFATPYLIAAFHGEELLAGVPAVAARPAWNRLRAIAAAVIHAPWYVCSNPWTVAAGVLRLCEGVELEDVARVSGLAPEKITEMREGIMAWLECARA